MTSPGASGVNVEMQAMISSIGSSMRPVLSSWRSSPFTRVSSRNGPSPTAARVVIHGPSAPERQKFLAWVRSKRPWWIQSRMEPSLASM
jgi:hypothetical protein